MEISELKAELEKLHPASFGWALSCCRRNPAEAEEVLQTVYLKILQGKAIYRGESKLQTWLFAVIRKTAVGERRKQWLRTLISLPVTTSEKLEAEFEKRSRIVFAKEGVKQMKAIIASLFAAAFLIATVVAQRPNQPPQSPQPPNMSSDVPDHPHPPNPDPLAHLMFPPDMIMAHARQLNLTDDQKAFMRSEIQKTTSAFQDLQWKLQDQMEQLQETMKSPTVNEQQALAQLDKVLDIEREIKRLHIGLAVRLKNRLTPEQQDQLHKMRMEHHPGMPGGPDGPPPIQ